MRDRNGLSTSHSEYLAVGRVGFKHRYVLHSHATVGHRLKPRVGLVIEILGQIFRRRIDHRERLNIVDHLVIEALDDVLHDLAQIFEIEQQAGLVEFLPASVTRIL